MKKLLAVVSVAAVFPLSAMAAGENNVGCGWGSKVFDGQSGVAPQVLAATSNNFYGTQTFAITSGTSGCTQDGTVKSSWKTALFIDGNKEKLARDMSVGSGEALDALAHLLGVQEQDRAAFNRAAKDHGRCPTANTTTGTSWEMPMPTSCGWTSIPPEVTRLRRWRVGSRS